MRKIVLFMHTSLDGFVAGPKGEMDWITVDEEIFDFAGEQTDAADAALYGRVTYEMMNGYWPTAGEEPDASRHDRHHSTWYNRVQKIVLSRTLDEAGLVNTRIISDNLSDNLSELKKQAGKNILIFGSPTAVHTLFNLGLIDEFWLFVSPILIGQGIPLFKDVKDRKKLKLLGSKSYRCGVVGLNYGKGEQ